MAITSAPSSMPRSTVDSSNPAPSIPVGTRMLTDVTSLLMGSLISVGWGRSRGGRDGPVARGPRPARRRPRGRRPGGPRRSVRRGGSRRRCRRSRAAGCPAAAAPGQRRRGVRRRSPRSDTAAASAASSTTAPRAVLTRTAVGFIRSNAAAPSRPRRPLGQGRVDRDVVGLGQQLVEPHEAHALVVTVRLRDRRRAQHLHPESVRQWYDGPGCGAVPDEAEGRPAQLVPVLTRPPAVVDAGGAPARVAGRRRAAGRGCTPRRRWR